MSESDYSRRKPCGGGGGGGVEEPSARATCCQSIRGGAGAQGWKTLIPGGQVFTERLYNGGVFSWGRRGSDELYLNKSLHNTSPGGNLLQRCLTNGFPYREKSMSRKSTSPRVYPPREPQFFLIARKSFGELRQRKKKLAVSLGIPSIVPLTPSASRKKERSDLPRGGGASPFSIEGDRIISHQENGKKGDRLDRMPKKGEGTVCNSLQKPGRRHDSMWYHTKRKKNQSIPKG